MGKTLSDLAGIPAPEMGVEGASLAPVVRGDESVGKAASYSQMARCFRSYTASDRTCYRKHDDFNSSESADQCEKVPRQCIQWMGYTVRTMNWRYTEWVEFDGDSLRPNFNRINATELYHHTGPDYEDFGASENINVAGDPAYKAVISHHRTLLQARFGLNNVV